MKYFKTFEDLSKVKKITKVKNPNKKSDVKTAPGIISSTDLMNLEFDEIDFTGDWEKLFGDPAPNFDMMIDGGPGSGKTTFLLKFAKYLAVKFGKVLYVSSEEYGTATLNQKIEDIEAVSDNLFFADNLNYNLDDFDFVFIDSINDMSLKLSEYKDIREEYPLTAFILVFQHTKAEDYRGSKEWEHEMEIAATIEKGIITVYKNRYGVKGELNVFEPISSLDKKSEK